MRSGRGLALLAAAAAVALTAGSRGRIDAVRLVEDVRFLSSPQLSGRGTATPGVDQAAEYIAAKFAEVGLKPLSPDGYFQPFPVTTGAVLGANNSLSYESGGVRTSLTPKQSLPFNFSGTGSASGHVVFAGYGVSAREYGYDDYAGLDVAGKVVLILRHEPQEFDGDSVFEGRVYTEHSQLLSKALNARSHGAKAILFVADTANHSNGETFEAFTNLPSPENAGIPYVQVESAVVEEWFRSSGREFAAVQQNIDRDLRPGSFSFPEDLKVSINVDIRREDRQTRNVAGYLPGKTDEYVVIGAHYDHLGTGEQYSLSPNSAGMVHPGADDNASGTAGLIALARALSRMPMLNRGVLFLAFGGEEIGLLGSAYYVDHPLLPLSEAVAMINMDMIGRMRDKRVIVGGAGSGSGFDRLLEVASKRHNISLDTDQRAVYGSSDHTTFKARFVPILFFFTGLHSDYHRPSDTWEKVEGKNTAALLELISYVAEQLCMQPERPLFVATPAPGQKSIANSVGGSKASKYIHDSGHRSR